MSNFGTTDFDYRVALDLVDGWHTWSVFGENLDLPIGTEVVASFGGTWFPMGAAETMSVVSTDVNDIAAGTGATQVYIEGLDSAYAHITETVVLNGTTPVITTAAFRGINRMTVTGSGATNWNAGTITATSTTALTIEADIEPAAGVSQQVIYHTSSTGTILVRSMHINALNVLGAAPVVILHGYVYSSVTGSRIEVFRHSVDTITDNFDSYTQVIPFPIHGSSVFWMEATSDKAGAQVTVRLSLVEYDA